MIMRDELLKEEIDLLEKARHNPERYSVEVDNDDIFLLDLDKDEAVGDFRLYGQEMIVALLKYIGANANFV